jgi:upstream activation factor subunit UAF30
MAKTKEQKLSRKEKRELEERREKRRLRRERRKKREAREGRSKKTSRRRDREERGEKRRKKGHKKSGRKGNPAFMRPLQLSEPLAAICGGKDVLPRTEVTKRLWAYIKENELQSKKDGRIIKPDKKLAKVLGSEPINMMKMTKKVQKHLSPIKEKKKKRSREDDDE